MERLNKEKVEFIIIHHSNRTFDCPFFIKLRHKLIRGWSDTGYHFIIGNGIVTKNGQIYNARPVDYVGAHAYGYNTKSIGICILGNFDFFAPSFKQYRSLIKLILILKNEFNVPSENVLSHNETTLCEKTCPGKLVPIQKIRKLL